MDVDQRGFRVAVVADELVNPAGGGFDALAVLNEEDWGAIQLPPSWYPPQIAAPLLEQVAEHVEEFARHGYDIVLVGDRVGLRDALGKVGAEHLDSIRPGSAAELRSFLHRRPPVDPALARGELTV